MHPIESKAGFPILGIGTSEELNPQSALTIRFGLFSYLNGCSRRNPIAIYATYATARMMHPIEMWEGQAGRARAFGELAERSPPLPLSQIDGSRHEGPFASCDRLLFFLLSIIIIYVFAVYLCRHKVYIMLRAASHTRLVILPLNGLVSYSLHVPNCH